MMVVIHNGIENVPSTGLDDSVGGQSWTMMYVCSR